MGQGRPEIVFEDPGFRGVHDTDALPPNRLIRDSENEAVSDAGMFPEELFDPIG
jgi:hypothetical protein